MSVNEFFIPPSICTGPQLLFLTCVYGFILFKGSSLISDGSELLLLVPAISGMVGSIVLPLLGAVPDSLMVIFSGLSDHPEETLSVGVGALAGSTIMLLTVPWFLSVVGGRVAIDFSSGKAVYSKTQHHVTGLGISSLYAQGVESSSIVKKNAVFMMMSSLLYLSIQVPSLILSPDNPIIDDCSLAGCLACLVVFVVYVWNQYAAGKVKDSVVSEIVAEARVDAIRAGEVTLLGAMRSLLAREDIGGTLDRPLIEIPDQHVEELRRILLPFFKQYESRSVNSRIGFTDFRSILHDVGMDRLSLQETESLFARCDQDVSGHIDFDEFVQLALMLIKDIDQIVDVDRFFGVTPPPVRLSSTGAEDEEDDFEIPEDLVSLTAEQQQWRIKLRAAEKMCLGTFLVFVFSDPAVEVMTEIASRVDVSPFFVSFVLAPLASNASEVIAAYNYASRKSRKSIQVALTTLEGAVCLNNTFCLAVFLGIVYARQVQWSFTAEVVSIVLAELAVGLVAISRPAFRLIDSFMILSIYPLSLFLVKLLKLAGVN